MCLARAFNAVGVQFCRKDVHFIFMGTHSSLLQTAWWHRAFGLHHIGVVVVQIDRNVSAVAAAFGFLQDLFAGFLKAEACTPTTHVVAAASAERKEFIPMLFHKEQNPADDIFLFCLIVAKGIAVDVNMQTASTGLMRTVAHGNCLPENFFPVHFLCVVL